jgi:hypothetical protein
VEATRQIQQSARHFGEQRLHWLENETERLLAQAHRDHPEAAIDAIAGELARELIGADSERNSSIEPDPDFDPDA